MKLHLRRAGTWLTCLLLAVALMPAAAFARGFVDLDRDSTLTVTYDCPGIEFRLYKVANVSKVGEFTLSGDFVNAGVKLDNKSDEEWQAAAETLDAYAAQYEPLERKTTGADGTLTFEPKKPGLYLVTWSQHTTGGYIYTPQPFLVCLPGLDKEDNWVYQATADPKPGTEKVPDQPDPTPTTVDREALKVWKDNGDTQDRPSSVTVLLLRDGKVYDEVTLNEGNYWKYQWTDLDAKYNWQVVEKEVPDGYTVTVRKNGTTFVVTNTLTPHIPPDTPDVPDEPNTPDEPDLPDYPDVPDTPDVPDEPGEPDIPQTGQLWWPVPLMACGGMLLFLAGWVKRRSGDCGETDER